MYFIINRLCYRNEMNNAKSNKLNSFNKKNDPLNKKQAVLN